MKATGIVRRIDDLGRVVIPKEIRRTLRIREGDPLEIYVDRDGEVILKKYSPIGELGEFAMEYAESLYENTQFTALITDRDHIIASAGSAKKTYQEQAVGQLLEQSMEQRKSILITETQEQEVRKDHSLSYTSLVIAPIISGGDPIGSVLLVTQEEGKQMGVMEQKMVETAAGFLAKHMEH